MHLNPSQFIVPHFWRKFTIMFTAILIMGFFVSFLIEINWGTDPCTFMNRSISQRIGWTFGNWQIVLNICMLVLTVFLDRKLIGFGTIANMVLIGYTADFCCWLWGRIIPPQIFTGQEFFALRIVIFAIVIIGFVFSAAVYMNADMGLSPYDSTSFIISHKLSRIPFSITRIIYDLLAISIGIVFSIGTETDILHSLPGSIVMALTLGPAITMVGKVMSRCMKD